MLDYILHIKPLEDQGLTDIQIVNHISNMTANPIPCGEMKIVLESNGLVLEDPVNLSRFGSLIDYYTSMPSGEEKSLLAWFISHVFNRGIELSSNTYPRSVQFAAVASGLPASMQPSIDEIIALGGGRPFEGSTQQDIDDARTVYQNSQAEEVRRNSLLAVQADINNIFINPAISDGATSAEELKSAIKAGL